MRIVNRKTFLAMPEGTLFGKYTPCSVDGELAIKGETSGNDFWQQGFVGWFADGHDSGDYLDTLILLENGGSAALDFNCQDRDGLFDADQLFAVFEPEDMRALILRLIAAYAAVMLAPHFADAERLRLQEPGR